MEYLLKGLLPRIPMVEQIEPFIFDISVHPERDAGIIKSSAEILRAFVDKYDFSVVILDHDGCGMESSSRIEIENKLENDLSKSGWNNRCCAIAIDPELENWIWVNERRMEEAISWENDQSIYRWLASQGWKNEDEFKPSCPKEAFEASLRLSQTPRSSSIYYEISHRASYKKCTDPAFIKLLSTIKKWSQ